MFQVGDLIAATKDMEVTNYLPKGHNKVVKDDLFLVVECDYEYSCGYSLYNISADSFSWWAVDLSIERCFRTI